MMEERSVAGEYFSRQARVALNEEEAPGKAFFYFCLALEASPELAGQLKTPFATSLCSWGTILEHEGKYTDLFSSYERALALYPDNELILNNLGAHLCRLQQPRAALSYFKSALAVNENYLPAYVNLEVTKNMLVERWHFRMLNDSQRNKAFRDALTRRLSQGAESVLDIGSGSGLLSIYARQAAGEAAQIFGCDYSEVMCSISGQVLRANNLEDSIKIINKPSTELSIPADLPRRVSLVVTETFDSGLLGEHILQTLIHAWEELIEPQANCKTSQQVIPRGAILCVAPIESLRIARKYRLLKSNRLTRISFQQGLDLSQINLSSKLDEPYDTENLKEINCSFLAQSEILLEFDFNDISQLKKYNDGLITKNITIKLEKEGYIDALAVWFDLILDKEISLSSSPLVKTICCWEQAVFGVNSDLHSTDCSNILLEASCESGILELNSAGRVLLSESEESRTVPLSSVAFLNCESLLLTIAETCDFLLKRFGGSLAVLDLSAFPYLGALTARGLNSRTIYSHSNDEVWKGSEKILDQLNLNCSTLKSMDWNQVAELMKEQGTTKFNVITADIIEPTGQISEDIVAIIPQLRDLLAPDGLFLPASLEVWCELVYCEEFQRTSQIQVLGDELHIAEFVNEYKVSQMIDFNIHDLNYKKMSSTLSMGQIDVREATKEMFFQKEVESLSSGEVSGVIYWFSCSYLGGAHFTTISSDSHLSQAASLLETPISVQSGTRLKVRLQYNSGAMRFFVEEG